MTSGLSGIFSFHLDAILSSVCILKPFSCGTAERVFVWRQLLPKWPHEFRLGDILVHFYGDSKKETDLIDLTLCRINITNSSCEVHKAIFNLD